MSTISTAWGTTNSAVALLQRRTRASTAASLHTSAAATRPRTSTGAASTCRSLHTSTASSSAASSFAVSAVAHSLRNGLLQHDDYFVNGVPPPRFVLSPRAPSLAAIFAAHARPGVAVDPFEEVAPELGSLNSSITRALGTDHPLLAQLAGVFFETHGKRVRPALVFLMAQAMQSGERVDSATAAAATADVASSSGTQEGSHMALHANHMQPQEIDIDLASIAAHSTAAATDESEQQQSLSDSIFSPSTTATATATASALQATSLAADSSAAADEDLPDTTFAISSSFPRFDARSLSTRTRGITESQRRLAELVEMIHTASLLHDDVIDESSVRRGSPSCNSRFGNKLAILGGDFFLARACISLARLRNAEVVELISTVIEHLVKGEIMQLKPSLRCGHTRMDDAERRRIEECYAGGAAADSDEVSAASRGASSSFRYFRCRPGLPSASDAAAASAFTAAPSSSSSAAASLAASLAFHSDLSHYLTKSYYKTASLLANSCRSVALLGAHSAQATVLAYEFGKNLGLAFQVVDDLLDARASSAILGKPSMADLGSGAITAPLLFALRAFPEEVLPILQRRGKQGGDAERMRELMAQSRALEQTQRLAEECAEAALAALLQLKPSRAQSALVQLVQRVLTREK